MRWLTLLAVDRRARARGLRRRRREVERGSSASSSSTKRRRLGRRRRDPQAAADPERAEVRQDELTAKAGKVTLTMDNPSEHPARGRDRGQRRRRRRQDRRQGRDVDGHRRPQARRVQVLLPGPRPPRRRAWRASSPSTEPRGHGPRPVVEDPLEVPAHQHPVRQGPRAARTAARSAPCRSSACRRPDGGGTRACGATAGRAR